MSLKIFLEPWESEGSLGLVELVRARRSFKAKIKAPHSAKHWRHERDLYDFKLSNLNHELWIIRGQASTQISDPSLKNVLVYHIDGKTICQGKFYLFQPQTNNCTPITSNLCLKSHYKCSLSIVAYVKIEKAAILKLFGKFGKKFDCVLLLDFTQIYEI